MKDIFNFLEKIDFNIEQYLLSDNGDITHVYAKKDNLSICIIGPHSGNDFQYLLRANPTKTLDRWGVCDIQRCYSSAETLIEKFSLEKIYKDLLDIYVKAFIEFEEENR